MIFLSLKM
ncbi:hypothetical protein VCCP10303_1235, partial [Vibrio cholerae CP1030(3)]